MRGVDSLRDFLFKHDQWKFDRDLFGFFLFDASPSHAVVQKFAADWPDFLDDEARSAEMYLFVPIPGEGDKQFKNPSVDVAKMFGIDQEELPGIVLFTVLESPVKRRPALSEVLSIEIEEEPGLDMENPDPIYLPLKTELFENDDHQAEQVLKDFFALIRECRAETRRDEELLKNLESKINGYRRKREMRPVIVHLKGAAVSLLTVSWSILIELMMQEAKEPRILTRIFG